MSPAIARLRLPVFSLLSTNSAKARMLPRSGFVQVLATRPKCPLRESPQCRERVDGASNRSAALSRSVRGHRPSDRTWRRFPLSCGHFGLAVLHAVWPPLFVAIARATPSHHSPAGRRHHVATRLGKYQSLFLTEHHLLN